MLQALLKGGPGSGDRDHVGRPGQVGGSGPSGSERAHPAQAGITRGSVEWKRVTAVAKRWGSIPTPADAVDRDRAVVAATIHAVMSTKEPGSFGYVAAREGWTAATSTDATGAIQGIGIYQDFRQGQDVYLQYLTTLPSSHRIQSAGTSVLVGIINDRVAQGKGAGVYLKSTPEARGYYEHLGFTPEGNDNYYLPDNQAKALVKRYG